MAKGVIAQLTGGEPKKYDNVETIGELRKKHNVASNYVALLNGETPSDGDSTELEDRDQVDFSQDSKSGK